MNNTNLQIEEMKKQLLLELYDLRDQDGWCNIGDVFPDTPKSLWNSIAIDLLEKGYIMIPGNNNMSLAKITPLGIDYVNKCR